MGQTLVWASIFYLFPALLLRWEDDLGWSKPELTLAISAAVLVAAAVSPFTGWLIDRGQGARLMGAAACLGGISLLGLSVVTAIWQFYLAWVLLGMAMAGTLYEPCFAMITRARGDKARPAIVFVTLIAGFASTISFPVAFALSEALGWRVAVRFIACVVIFVVAPVLWRGASLLERSRTARVTREAADSSSRSFLRLPRFWFLALGFGCLATVHGATLQHFLPILDERGLSAGLAVLAASLIGPMQVAGRLAMMATERHLTSHGVTIAAFLSLGLSILVLSVAGASPELVLTFVVLFGSAYGTVSILRPLLAREILGEENFGAKSGALAVPYLAGSALAPYLGSLVWSLGGYTMMLWLLLAVTVAGAVLYLAAARR